jgi:general secretion pathway protein F
MPESSRAISIEEFVVLNDEIAALVRAGVPLELGLQGFSRDASGRLRELSHRLSRRIGAGESLEQAIELEGDSFPRIYRFAISAGLKTGHLARVMESLSSYARLMSRTRRQVAISLIYPALIVVVAYYLFFLVAMGTTDFLDGAVLEPGAESPPWRARVASVSGAIAALGHFPPVIFIGCLMAWGVASRFFSRSQPMGLAGLKLIPGVRSFLRESRLANFSELSSILLSEKVPLSEALPLAAESVGDARLIHDADQLAAADARGAGIAGEWKQARSFPPLMQWMLDVGARQGSLAATFGQLADLYRVRAAARLDRFQVLFPVLLAVVVGGGAVLLYALAVFLPITEIMHTLSIESSRTN